MINWKYYPTSSRPGDLIRAVVDVFLKVADDIDSSEHYLVSNVVLEILRPGLESTGFQVEKGKKGSEKIKVPVLFGLNGKLEKSFDADAFNQEHKMVLEVEAGRAVTNHQFLKDLFQACMMHEVQYLGIAVRNHYKNSDDFIQVIKFFDTMYASQRLKLPLQGILVIGY